MLFYMIICCLLTLKLHFNHLLSMVFPVMTNSLGILSHSLIGIKLMCIHNLFFFFMCVMSVVVMLLLFEALYNSYDYQSYTTNNIYLEIFFIWSPTMILLMPTLYYLTSCCKFIYSPFNSFISLCYNIISNIYFYKMYILLTVLFMVMIFLLHHFIDKISLITRKLKLIHMVVMILLIIKLMLSLNPLTSSIYMCYITMLMIINIPLLISPLNYFLYTNNDKKLILFFCWMAFVMLLVQVIDYDLLFNFGFALLIFYSITLLIKK